MVLSFLVYCVVVVAIQVGIVQNAVLASAIVNKGDVLGELGRSQEEIAVYDQVVRRFGDATEAGIREQVASAMFNKGVTLYQMERY
ncbi:MAG: hypothetical protein ACPL7O_06780, partial [Armatimonadota bacterium]